MSSTTKSIEVRASAYSGYSNANLVEHYRNVKNDTPVDASDSYRIAKALCNMEIALVDRGLVLIDDDARYGGLTVAEAELSFEPAKSYLAAIRAIQVREDAILLAGASA